MKNKPERKPQEKRETTKDKQKTEKIFAGRTGRRKIQLPVYEKSKMPANEFTQPEPETC